MGAEFCSLVSCNAPISRAARKVHGITPEMLVGQPNSKEVMTRFRDFIGSSVLVAHNAPFDISFLRMEMMRVDLYLLNRYKCTLKMSRKAFPGLQDYRLETVASHLGIDVDGGRLHRALDDARLTARVWIEMGRKG